MSENPISLTTWTEVVAVDDIPALGSRVIKSTVGTIALFKAFEGQIFAILDECPHKKGPLSQGIVHGTTVTCPLHAWNINLIDGNACAPDEGCVRTFQTHIENGKVYLLRSEITSHA
jgi:nitrite reductase (NADH) small subunit